jgi:hypothetical protein
LGFAGTAQENAGENHEIRNYLLMLLDDIRIEACNSPTARGFHSWQEIQ